MSGGHPGGGEARGFAGLLSLVSQVSDQPEIKRPDSTDTVADVSGPSAGKPEQTPTAEPRIGPQPSSTVLSKPSGSKKGWIIVGALAACVGIWIAAENGEQTYSPPSYTPPRYNPAPEPSPPPEPDLRRSQFPTRTEDVPIAGDGSRTLNQGNIRWCLFQDRRIEIIRSAILTSTEEADVSNFNSLVTDYNNRCGRYRYRETDMSVVRGELPSREPELRSQAEQIINSWPSRRQASSPGRTQVLPPYWPSASAPSTAARPTDHEVTRSELQFDLLRIEDATKIQQRLAELGFFGGASDGIWSRRSRQALREFKSVNGLSQDDAWDELTASQLFAENARRKTAANTKGAQSNAARGSDTYYTPPPGTTLNPLNRADATNLQKRLGELGFFAGQNDGVWGPASRGALRDFKTKNGLSADDQWNAETERALKEGQATEAFLGGWADDTADCKTAPIQITVHEAKGNRSVCKFGSIQREDNSWRIQAVCTIDGRTSTENITLSILNARLTWSTEAGRKTYIRCEGG